MIWKRHFWIPALTVITLNVGLWMSFQPSAEAQKTIAPALKFGDPLPANAFVELARITNPAVVNISTTTTPRGGRIRDPFLDMLEQFYGIPMAPKLRPQQSLGTGFIIREDGLIVTNNHVIAGADVINVQIKEGDSKPLEARVIGSDDRTDIALIKIEGSGYPTLQLGSSAQTEVGEWVAAFGNPFNNGHTMTKGIISAKNRDISEINRFPLLQTDAPINPGNSGGPLMNLKGQVIGVNSAIDARAQGIGFAIPIDEVKSILPQLEKSGSIRKGYLGVGLADIDPRSAMELGLNDTEGSLIMQVNPGFPGEKAGLRPGDVVVEFSGKKIRSTKELMDAVADAEIGKKATMKVIRDGKSRTFSITPGERPGTPVARAAPKKHKGTEAPYGLGFQVADINEALRRDFHLPKDIKRPVVVSVERGSRAEQGGLMPGDVILFVNRTEVKSAADVRRLLKKGTNTFNIYRDGVTLFRMIRQSK